MLLTIFIIFYTISFICVYGWFVTMCDKFSESMFEGYLIQFGLFLWVIGLGYLVVKVW